MAKKRKTFSPEFRLEAAGLVVDQDYTVKAACDAMGVSKTSMENWVRQLRQERRGQMPKTTAMTPDQRRIQELEKQLRPIHFISALKGTEGLNFNPLRHGEAKP